MKQATVSQARPLRDGRQLAEILSCPYCAGSHWVIADSTLAYVPCAPNRPIWLDGLGSASR